MSGYSLCLATGRLNRFQGASKRTFDNPSIINNDCGVRANNLKGGGQRDRRIRLISAHLVFLHPFFSLLSQSTRQSVSATLLFPSVVPLRLPVPVRSSDINGLPQDRLLRLGRMDGQSEKVTVLTEIVFDICRTFIPALSAPLMLILFVRQHKLIFCFEEHGFSLIVSRVKRRYC